MADESGEVPLTEVRSLEDIYREKALRSLMEAKKKKGKYHAINLNTHRFR